jgi:predicted O-methyltransferase YrrM
MAVSLETSAFLLYFCQITQRQHILDLGSGFSSFIFRLYASKVPGVRVYSVDDNKIWLSRTEKYLAQKNLSTSNLIYLNDLDFRQYIGYFDLVFHDLGNIDTRMRFLQDVIHACDPQKGFVILDDIHKTHYQTKVVDYLKANSCSYHYLLAFTYDSLGRYASMLQRKC